MKVIETKKDSAIVELTADDLERIWWWSQVCDGEGQLNDEGEDGILRRSILVLAKKLRVSEGEK